MGDALDPKARGRIQDAFRSLRGMLVAGVVEGADERMVAILRDAIPVGAGQEGAGKAGSGGAALAEDAALTFRRCLALAPRIGFAGEARAKVQAVVEGIERHAVAMIKGARAAGSDPGQLPDLEADLIGVIRVVELAAGPDDADALLARLRARMG
jgi:hypothetical protein